MTQPGDPRVLFAAERTLLAWNRTGISLMTFGFVVERFGLFLEIIGREEVKIFQRHISFFVGISFILLASFISVFSVWQYRLAVKQIPPKDIPAGHQSSVGMIVNGLIALLGVVLSIYLASGLV